MVMFPSTKNRMQPPKQYSTGGAILYPGANPNNYGYGQGGQTQNPSVYPSDSASNTHPNAEGGGNGMYGNPFSSQGNNMLTRATGESGGSGGVPAQGFPGGMGTGQFGSTPGGGFPQKPGPATGMATPTGSGNFRPSPGGQAPSIPGVPGLGAAGGGAGMTVPGFQGPGAQPAGGGSGTSGMMIPEVGGAANMGQPGSGGAFNQMQARSPQGHTYSGQFGTPNGLAPTFDWSNPEAQRRLAQSSGPAQGIKYAPYQSVQDRLASYGRPQGTDNFTGQNYRQFTNPDGTNYMADRSYFTPSASSAMSPARQNFLNQSATNQQPFDNRSSVQSNATSNTFGQQSPGNPQFSPATSNAQPNRMTLDQQMAQKRSGELAGRTQGPQGGTTGSVSDPAYQQNIQNMNAGRTAGGNTQTLNANQYQQQQGGSPMARGGNQTSYYQPFNRPTPGDPGTWVAGTSQGALGNTGSAPGSHNTWRPPQANQQGGGYQGSPNAGIDPRMGLLQNLMSNAQAQQNAYNASTAQRDDLIRRLYGQRQDNVLGWQGDSAANLSNAYKGREDAAMEMVGKIGQGMINDVNDLFAQNAAKIQAHGVNTGLNNTTIPGSMQTGNTQAHSKALVDALDQIGRLNLGTYLGTSGDRLGADRGLHSERVGLLQQMPKDLIDYLERIDPMPPDMNSLVNLAFMAGGQGGMVGGQGAPGGGTYYVPSQMWGGMPQPSLGAPWFNGGGGMMGGSGGWGGAPQMPVGGGFGSGFGQTLPGGGSLGGGAQSGGNGFGGPTGGYDPYQNIPENPYQPGDPGFIGPVPGMGGTQPTGTPGGGPAGGATGGGAQAPPLPPQPTGQGDPFTGAAVPFSPDWLQALAGMNPAPQSPAGIPTPQAGGAMGVIPELGEIPMPPQYDWTTQYEWPNTRG